MKETKAIIERLKHYFENIPIVMEAVEKLEWLDSYNANLQAANTALSCELSDMAEKLEKAKEERDELARKSEDPCLLCGNYIRCEGEKCDGFCKGVGDAEGKWPTMKWTCEDFTYGTCTKLENTPCNGCIQNGYKGFKWKEKE